MIGQIMKIGSKGIGIFCALGLIVTLLNSAALAENRYPMVFDSPDKLKPLGIVLLLDAELTNKTKLYANRCYYYGDGGWNISISDALLNSYKALGFSRRSACLALVSGIKFNPESGARLATA